MSDYYAVTTFSPSGFECYGRRFIETFLAHWDIPLVVFYEGKEPPRLSHSRLCWMSLDADVDRASFIKKYSGPTYNLGPAHPNSQAVRFCHKVFAVTYPLHGYNAFFSKSNMTPGGRMLWIDADVETFATVNQDALHEMLPLDASVSFLGRTNWPWSETGFVGYDLGAPGVRAMLADMRWLYVTGELFKRQQNAWHDGATFDWARRKHIPKQQQCNLTRGENGINPWPLSVLGKHMRHHKGPGMKMRAYGGLVE